MSNTILTEGSFADALRKDLVGNFLKTISDDDISDDDISDISEIPDYDLLLEPDHFEGYEYQTTIQYIDENTFKYYEGFSTYCWNAFKKQKQYKGKSKEDIILHFIENRMKTLCLQFGYNLINSEYFIHESCEYNDYILILTYKNDKSQF